MPERPYTKEIYDPIKLAYLAGIIDGEGCFTIYKVAPAKYNRFQNPQYRSSLTICNTKIELMEWLDETFKNLNHSHKQHRRFSRKDHLVYDRMIYEWTLQGFRLVDICNQVLPYLVIKRKQCALVVKFRETYTGNRYGSTKGLEPHLLAEREHLRTEMGKLNAKTLFLPLDHITSL